MAEPEQVQEEEPEQIRTMELGLLTQKNVHFGNRLFTKFEQDRPPGEEPVQRYYIFRENVARELLNRRSYPVAKIWETREKLEEIEDMKRHAGTPRIDTSDEYIDFSNSPGQPPLRSGPEAIIGRNDDFSGLGVGSGLSNTVQSRAVTSTATARPVQNPAQPQQQQRPAATARPTGRGGNRRTTRRPPANNGDDMVEVT